MRNILIYSNVSLPMNAHAQKIVHIIKNSELSQENKKILLKHFLSLPEKDLKLFVPVLENKPELLQDLSTLIHDKIDVLKKGDQDAWKKILDREITLFKSIVM